MDQLHRFKLCGLERCHEPLMCLFYRRCREESNHREFKKASGAFAVQFNEETRSLEVLVRLNSCFHLSILMAFYLSQKQNFLLLVISNFILWNYVVCLFCVISVYSLLVIVLVYNAISSAEVLSYI